MDDVGALRLAERPEAPVDVFGAHGEVVGGAGLELGQGARHGQRQRLHLADPLPVLLGGGGGRGVVLVEGVQVVAVHRRARAVRLRHAPGQHDARLARHQLQLRLLRRRGLPRLQGEAAQGGQGGQGEGREHGGGGPAGGRGRRAVLRERERERERGLAVSAPWRIRFGTTLRSETRRTQ